MRQQGGVMFMALVLVSGCEKAVTVLTDDKQVTVAASVNVQNTQPPDCPLCLDKGLSVHDYCSYAPRIGMLDVNAAVEAKTTWDNGRVHKERLILWARCAIKGKASDCDVATVDYTSNIVDNTSISVWKAKAAEVDESVITITETGSLPQLTGSPRRITVDFLDQRVRYVRVDKASGRFPGSETRGEGLCKGGVFR